MPFIGLIVYSLATRPKKNLITELKIPSCQFCFTVKSRTGNSTPQDLVIGGVFGNTQRAISFIRSLRSVGSRASIVYVTNETVSDIYYEQIERCGVEFFIMKSTSRTNSLYPHSLRYVGIRQFMEQDMRQFSRVLHADSYDIFFQMDPFNENIQPEFLYFVLEDIKIKDSEWNTGWLTRAYNESIASSLGENIVSCSGTIIGGYQQFKIYISTLLGHPPFWANGRHSLDQAYHNYLLHNGILEANGIRPKYFGCNSHILTMHYCSRYGREVIRNGKVYCPDGKTKPAIVHQYNLFQGASEVLSRMCPK